MYVCVSYFHIYIDNDKFWADCAVQLNTSSKLRAEKILRQPNIQNIYIFSLCDDHLTITRNDKLNIFLS